MNWNRRNPNNRFTRGEWILLAVIAVFLIFVLTSCSIGRSKAKASPGMYILVQDTGAGGSGKISKVVYPGHAVSKAPDDIHWKLPAGSRNFICTNDPATDCQGHPMSGFTKSRDGVNPGAELIVLYRADWRLNPNEQKLREFFDQVCQKYTCAVKSGQDDAAIAKNNNYSTPGWNAMLKENFYTSAQGSLLKGLTKFDASELLLNTNDSWTKLAATMSENFMPAIREATNNGDFFCGTNTIVGRTCDPIGFTVIAVGYANADQRAQLDRLNTALAAKQADVEEQNREDEKQRRQIEREKASADAAAANAVKPGTPTYEADQARKANIEVAKACAASANCTLIVGNGQPVINK